MHESGTEQPAGTTVPAVTQPVAVEKPARKRTKAISRNRRERLRKVRTLYYVQKWTQSEIAESLKVSLPSIARDIKTLKQLASNEASEDNLIKKDVLDFLFEQHLSYKRRIQYLWNDYNKSTNEFIRLKLLGEIRETEKHYISFMQESGVLPKEADKHLHAVQYISHLGKERKDVTPPEEKSQEPKQGEKDHVKEQIMAVNL